MNYTVWCKKFDDLSPQELFDIIQLRAKVFIVEQNCVYLDPDEKDNKSYHMAMYMDQKCVACTRILAPGISYEKYSSIGRVCTLTEYRRLSLGRIIMQKSIEETEILFPHVDIKISAQSYLIPFYQSFGFEVTGTEYMEDNIPHTGMIRSNN